jgi:type IV secretory pathway component VirB8
MSRLLKFPFTRAILGRFYSDLSDHSEFKLERWTASVTYVFRENVKNNELAVNPLGLTIVRFRADQAFS